MKATWLWCWAVQQALQSISAQCWSHTISYVYIHIWGGGRRLNIRFQCVHHAGCWVMCVGGWRDIYICMLYIASTAKSILFIVSCNCRLAPLSFNGTATRKGDFFPTLLFFFFLSYFFLCWIQLLLFLDVAIFGGKSRKLAVIAHSLLFIFLPLLFLIFKWSVYVRRRKKKRG